MLESFFYSDPIESEEIKEILLRAACAEPEAEHMAPVVKALVRVYWELREAEGVEEEEALVDGGREAEKLYQKIYCKVFRVEHKRAVKASSYPLEATSDTDEEILDGAPWPETLGVYGNGKYTALQYPRWLILTMAKAAAQREAAGSVQLAEWHIKSGIPGTPQHADFVRSIGQDAADKHVARISEWLDKQKGEAHAV